MAYRTVGFLLAALIFAALLNSAPAAAQQPGAAVPEIRIAVVDIIALTRNAALTKDIARQITKFRSDFDVQIRKEEEDLRKANDALNRKRPILSPEAFDLERKKFDERLRGAQNLVQERQRLLARIRSAGEAEFRRQISLATIEIANKRNLTLILRRREIIMIADAFDATKEVLAILDRNMPAFLVPKELLNPGPNPGK